MDVFLIPTATPARYELYYEAPDDDVVDTAEGSGMFARMKRRFAEMLRDAEEWRHRRHEQSLEHIGLFGKVRRKIMGFVVERIAEQRLLWHMRKATEICARIPADLDEAAAERIIRAMLKADTDHHLKWTLLDLALLIPATLLTVIPGPNIIGLYFTFQVVGHFLSWRGGKQGLTRAHWTFNRCPELAELREVMKLEAPQRYRRFRELENRLHLEHLARFLDEVAAAA